MSTYFTEFLSLQVPHALALIESMDRLCVADRENMRVTCPRAGLYSVQGKKEPALTIQQPDMGRVFGVAARGKQYNLNVLCCSGGRLYLDEKSIKSLRTHYPVNLQASK